MFTLEKEPDTALIIHPEIRLSESLRELDYVLEEAQGLAHAISLEVLDTIVFKVGKIQSGAFLGSGQREQISQIVENIEPTVVIFNATLSPVQQRNLEKEWGVKVIDRTALILEIFGARAQTKEGRLQVELAALDYQKSRLVRSWTHLERQRGGAGFMGGPGERQIELDRRIISDKMVRLKKQIEDVRRTRDLGRKARERVPFPIVALVGYTNAGKSTLFNLLTKAGVFAEDLPFATLDPTLRQITLPDGQNAILSDTVGFISDLPTQLVASFRATLEQIEYADVILHVIDVSRPDYKAQKQDVIQILKDLGINYDDDERIIELYNKMDALHEDIEGEVRRELNFNDDVIGVAAINGEGIDALLDAVSAKLSQKFVTKDIRLAFEDGKKMAWLYSHATVTDRIDKEDGIHLSLRISPENWQRFNVMKD